MSTFGQDLKVAARQLSHRPGFTLVAVLTLALGIGVNTVAFTLVNGLVFKSAANYAADELGRIMTTPGGDENGLASLTEYQRFAEATRGALDLAAEGRLSMAWQHDGTTQPAWVLVVSSNYFSIVSARAIAGRSSVVRAAEGVPSVVIGERFWRRKLNAASLAGLTLRLNDTAVSVAGVLPESFAGPAGLYSPDVWLPLDDLVLFGTSSALQKRDHRWLFLPGRVRPGTGLPEVQGRVDAAVAAMAHEWPDSHRGRGARFRLFKEANSERRGLRTAAAVAMGIIGLVLLLACFNVTSLLLARAVDREREMAVRAAIGAGPARLVRLVVTEGLLIAGLAGAASALLARWTQVIVGSFAIPIEQPQHIDLAPDSTVVGFILLLVLIAGVLPGLWPAWTVARIDVSRVLGSQGGNPAGGVPSPLRRWLVAAQVAGSTAFLAIAGLFAQSYGHLSSAEMGFERDRLVVAEFEPGSHGYDAARSRGYVDALLQRVRALPGIADAAVADRAPFFIGFDRLTPVSPAGAACEADACPKYATLAVGPGYFRTMGIPLTMGREFETGGSSADVIINQPLATELWAEGAGPGRRLRLGVRAVHATVAGVTARTRTRGLDREQPTLYVPLDDEHFQGGLTIVARTAIAPELLVRPIRDTAQALDAHVSMLAVKTMQQRMAVQLWPFRTLSWLFTICGILALILATVGLAGMVLHAVGRRMREFGVRVSLGATRLHLLVDVLRSSARVLLPGLIAGTLLAAVAARLVRAAFVGVDVLNPLTYLTVALLQSLIVIAACIRPALRASRVDPLVALRSE